MFVGKRFVEMAAVVAEKARCIFCVIIILMPKVATKSKMANFKVKVMVKVSRLLA